MAEEDDEPHFSYRLHGRGWPPNSYQGMHIKATGPKGWRLITNYYKYHGRDLWSLAIDYLRCSRIFGEAELSVHRESLEDSYIWFHSDLSKDELDLRGTTAIKALEQETLRSWQRKTALSLARITRERLQDRSFLIDSILAYTDLHGTQATRQVLLRFGFLRDPLYR